ncbi:MAG: twin-arginine translocase TatA/TatE family subunit [Chloroflexota bacterium]
MFGPFGGHGIELIILLVIVLVIFGPKKLPDLGKGLGQGIKEFKAATTGENEKDRAASETTAASTTTTTTVATGEAGKEPVVAKPAGDAKE